MGLGSLGWPADGTLTALTLSTFIVLVILSRGIGLWGWSNADQAGRSPFLSGTSPVSTAVLLLATLIGLWGLVDSSVDDPAQVWQGKTWWLVYLDTDFGRAALGHAVVVVAAALMGHSRSFKGKFGLGWLGVLAVASFALMGHGAAQHGFAGLMRNSVLMLHILAGCVWVGALSWMLQSVFAWPASDRAAEKSLANWIQHFGKRGLWIVPTIVLTGVLTAWWRNETEPDWWHSPQASLVLGKVMLLAMMGVCALVNRYVLLKAILCHETTLVDAVTAQPFFLKPYQAATLLRLNILLETTLGLAAVWLAVLLASSSPSP